MFWIVLRGFSRVSVPKCYSFFLYIVGVLSFSGEVLEAS